MMTQQTDRDLVANFIASGGKVQKCPDRTVLRTRQYRDALSKKIAFGPQN